MIEYREEQIDDVISEIKKLGAQSAIEQEGGKLEVSIDLNIYKYLEYNIMLHITTARDNGVLVGYCVYVINPHPHFNHNLFATNDTYFLRKDYRKGFTGYKLLKKAISFVGKRGVRNFLITSKISQDYPGLFKRLGFKPVEITYSLERKV